MTPTAIPLLYQIPLLTQLPPAPTPEENVMLFLMALITISLIIMAITAIAQMKKQTNLKRKWSLSETQQGDIIWKSRIRNNKPLKK